MVKLVSATVPPDHFDLLELPDRGWNSQELTPAFQTDHLVYKKVVDPVADDCILRTEKPPFTVDLPTLHG